MAVTRVGLKIEIAPSPARASPDQAATAQVVSTDPAELVVTIGDVRVFAVADEEVSRRLAERVVLALDRIVALVEALVVPSAMRQLPWLQPFGDVVLAMLHVS